MPKGKKVQVTERALIQRINRALAKNNQALRKARSPRVQVDLGEFFIVNGNINGVLVGDVDLEALGRELAVLEDWEALAE